MKGMHKMSTSYTLINYAKKKDTKCLNGVCGLLFEVKKREKFKVKKWSLETKGRSEDH
jgi:hypothetical protein